MHEPFKNGFSRLEGFPGGSVVRNLPANAGATGDASLIPVWKIPGEGNGNPLQYSCLENSSDRGAWQATSTGWRRAGHSWAHTHTVIKLVSRFRTLCQQSEILHCYETSLCRRSTASSVFLKCISSRVHSVCSKLGVYYKKLREKQAYVWKLNNVWMKNHNIKYEIFRMEWHKTLHIKNCGCP